MLETGKPLKIEIWGRGFVLKVETQWLEEILCLDIGNSRIVSCAGEGGPLRIEGSEAKDSGNSCTPRCRGPLAWRWGPLRL